MSHIDNDEQEKTHFQSVVHSFHEYSMWMEREVRRRETHIEKLSDSLKARLPEEVVHQKFESLREAVKQNQHFLKAVTALQGIDNGGEDLEGEKRSQSETDEVFESQETGAKILAEPQTPFRHFDKLMHTLHACVRHWSTEGSDERHSSFDPIVAELRRLLPDHRNERKVLVPGCGLGRLVFEIVKEGYSCQGNEFSYFMLLVGSMIMNHSPHMECYGIHPWIHDASNHMSHKDMLRPVAIPDKNPAEEISSVQGSPEFSIVAGEFLLAYSEQEACWDGIITCFFLDTAPNVIEYIQSIRRLLKPNGIWINLGPLQWHWQRNDFLTSPSTDSRYYESVELSYLELRHVIEKCDFKFLCRWRERNSAIMGTMYVPCLDAYTTVFSFQPKN